MKTHTRMITVILSVWMAISVSCQNKENSMQVKHHNNGSTEIRVSRTGKYILLPIEEKANESTISLRGQTGRMPMDVRLAENQIDYYVPFMLDPDSKENIIEINHPDAGTILWEKFELSDNFDKSNREKFRPLYHHAPEYGWMNDPNGMFYLDGEYHLFYQYNPYGSMWGNMHWGHAISTDLVHWKHEGVAIEPDQLGTVFSGNSIVDKDNVTGLGKNTIIAFYTSAGEKQTQSIAYSTDKGRSFIKYDKNPVVTADIPDFRDPNVFYHQPTGKWIMVIAAGQEVQLFSSANLLEWKYESAFGEGYGNHGGVWECPDLLEIPVEDEPGKTKWVLLLNINPGGIFGGSATQYFTGEFDGTTFTCESTPETEKWMDWGKDHYATVTWSNAPDNRKIAIAWMSNWQYANIVPTQQFRSANSIPRELKLYRSGNDSYLINEPVEELKTLRKNEKRYTAEVPGRMKPFHIESILENNKGAFELEITFSNITSDVFGFTLFNEKGEQVDMHYNLSEKRFYMDRTKSGETGFSNDFPVVTYAPVENTREYKLHIFVDRCSIESFSGDGKFVMTNLVFPDTPYNRISFYSKGGKFNVHTTIYEL